MTAPAPGWDLSDGGARPARPGAPAAGPAERALLEASRELAALHPLDRAEQRARRAGARPRAPWPSPRRPCRAPRSVGAPAVLDVLPAGSGRARSARDLVLPAVLLAELLAGVWLGAARPWQTEAADPLQARFSSTVPASDDLRVPGPAGPRRRAARCLPASAARRRRRSAPGRDPQARRRRRPTPRSTAVAPFAGADARAGRARGSIGVGPPPVRRTARTPGARPV